MKLTDEQKAEFEAELEETDHKALLIGIYSELQAIRTILESTQSQQDTSDAMVTCSMCNELQPTSEVVEHAIREHNAPEDIGMDAVVKGGWP